MNLVKQIVAFYLKGAVNDVWSAVVSLTRFQSLQLLPQYIEKENFNVVCSFLTNHARVWKLHKDEILDIAYQTYMKFKQYPDAVRVALRLENLPVSFLSKPCQHVMFLMLQQLCYILTRQGTTVEIKDHLISGNEDNEESLQEFVNNKKLRECYLVMARHLDMMDRKILNDIYKPDDCACAGDSIGSTLQNVAAIFVNAFVNAGFGQDISVTPPFLEGSTTCDCIFQNKDYEKITATGSLGLIALWNVDDGLSQLKRYLKSSDNLVVAGALLGVGILNSGIHSECHTTYGEFLAKEYTTIRIGAIIGLGFTYAGSCKEEVYSLLRPIITDMRNTPDIVAFSALSLGIVYAGSCHDGVRQIIHALMERNEAELGDPLARF